MGQDVVFCDVDGTLVEQIEFQQVMDGVIPPVLPGVKEKLALWHCQGKKIILTTGRPECLRELTVKTLAQHGIPYNMLLMDIPTGVRFLVNDRGSNGETKAIAVNVTRDGGLEGCNLE